ncbi:hypothetical protein CKA56_02705 [Arcobacter venerupis]|uniref:hypothetical protein n=1 Tax=Arcobacter venerupis TaxID=1054033 RepID=UPI000FEBC15A|nr:hypothetical protein [Arcobacter venerupis]RWS50460.1 hypothetical protein CKA56_02705 [Arcobacter venerupis]
MINDKLSSVIIRPSYNTVNRNLHYIQELFIIKSENDKFGIALSVTNGTVSLEMAVKVNI